MGSVVFLVPACPDYGAYMSACIFYGKSTSIKRHSFKNLPYSKHTPFDQVWMRLEERYLKV